MVGSFSIRISDFEILRGQNMLRSSMDLILDMGPFFGEGATGCAALRHHSGLMK